MKPTIDPLRQWAADEADEGLLRICALECATSAVDEAVSAYRSAYGSDQVEGLVALARERWGA